MAVFMTAFFIFFRKKFLLFGNLCVIINSADGFFVHSFLNNFSKICPFLAVSKKKLGKLHSPKILISLSHFLRLYEWFSALTYSDKTKTPQGLSFPVVFLFRTFYLCRV